MSTTTLHLAKQNFKFSAAHFLIFDETHAEKLHGHNYQVKVDINAPADESQHSDGYFMDFNVFKKFIKARLDVWDEIVLLPQNHPDMKFKKTDKSLEVTFRDRFYVFPLNEVILLPVTNTSVENLSKILAEEFYAEFKKYGVQKVVVSVEETQGQGASTAVGK
jgi:6-pyruvoyltetrahydropterin/6-carboxytetrahydropterin synthase